LLERRNIALLRIQWLIPVEIRVPTTRAALGRFGMNSTMTGKGSASVRGLLMLGLFRVSGITLQPGMFLLRQT